MAKTKTAAAKKSKKVQIVPLGDRVVVERDEAEKKTAGGIVLPDSAQDKPQRGRVVSIGEGRLLKDGRRHPLTVKKGDRILFSSYAGDEFKLDGEELVLMREEDILAILK